MNHNSKYLIDVNENKKAYNQLKQIEIDFRFITGRDIETGKLNSVRKIVEFIKTHQISNDIVCYFTIDLPDGSDNLTEKQIEAAYLVIWNLYHNASKGHKKLPRREEPWPITIKIYECQGRKVLSIENCGEINDYYKDQFLNKNQLKVNSLDNDRKTKNGLTIIKESMNKLDWSVSEVNVKDMSTEIIITTNKSKR